VEKRRERNKNFGRKKKGGKKLSIRRHSLSGDALHIHKKKVEGN
jgi:hypothetical protein